MPRKSKKTELLEIMKEILREYKLGIHRTQIDKCGLCKKYLNENIRHGNGCELCPMSVFHVSTSSYPCMNRSCRPVNCSTIFNISEIELKRVITFYEEVIAKIESMSTDAVRKSNFKFLIKIDEKVGNAVT